MHYQKKNSFKFTVLITLSLTQLFSSSYSVKVENSNDLENWSEIHNSEKSYPNGIETKSVWDIHSLEENDLTILSRDVSNNNSAPTEAGLTPIDGNYSGLVTNRNAPWQGIKLPLNNLEVNESYTFSCKIKLLDNSSGLNVTIKDNSITPPYRLIINGGTDKLAGTYNLSGDFIYNEGMDFLYISSIDSGVDFCIDTILLEKNGSPAFSITEDFEGGSIDTSPFVNFGPTSFTIISENTLPDASSWEEVYATDVNTNSNKGFFRTTTEAITPASTLSSGTLTHAQSWSQETNYSRTAQVIVPSSGNGPFPVLVLLHGSTGRATSYINRFSGFSGYIRVALQGYDPPPNGAENGNSGWNITSESSKADDADFVLSIINQLKQFSNVDSNNITLIGNSNGAGLVNKASIELPADAFKNAISIASQLFNYAYHDDSFWYNINGVGGLTNQITPAQGRRILSIHATGDSVIKYDGTTTWLDNGGFYPAQESIYIWAQAMGYSGDKIDENNALLYASNPEIRKFSYLDGQVMHYMITGSDHGLSGLNSTVDGMILDFIE